MRYVKLLLGAGVLILLGIAGCNGTDDFGDEVYSASGQKLQRCTPQGERRETGLIFIHGGGFSTGSGKDMLGFCKLLAQGGFPSVTISYRLTSGGHAFPAALNDVKSAVAWMRANAGTLGVNPDKIVLIGYSAGATLALSAGLEDQRIAGIVSTAGISEFTSARQQTPFEKLRQDIDAYLGETPAASASPLSRVSRGDPPVLLFHGRDDALVPIAQSVLMARALEARQVPVLFKVFEDAGHEIMLPNKHLETLLRDMTAFLVAIDAE